MISEEKIRAYVNMNIALAKLQVQKTGVRFSEEHLSNGIVNAAKWSISEFKRELWHDASEEPEKDKPFIFVQEFNGRADYHIGTVLRPEDYAKNRDFWCMVKWCYLTDILPKEGGEE